jgi:hypothetical protein
MAEKLEKTCNNCGSSFTLSYEEDEVSYQPTNCPFCGDYFEDSSEELDFSDDDFPESEDSLYEDDEFKDDE